MAGVNLTRDEARQRARLVSVDRYAVDLDLSRAGPTFASTTTIHSQVVDPAAGTFVDLIAAEVEAVGLNGRSLAVEDVVGDPRVTLDSLATTGDSPTPRGRLG